MEDSKVDVYLDELRHFPSGSAITLRVRLSRLHPKRNQTVEIKSNKAERFLAECDRKLTPSIRTILKPLFPTSTITVSYSGVRPGSLEFFIIIMIGKTVIAISSGQAATIGGLTTAYTVYTAITKYPDFEMGIKRIFKRIKQAGSWLEDKAANTFDWITTGSTEKDEAEQKTRREAEEKLRAEKKAREEAEKKVFEEAERIAREAQKELDGARTHEERLKKLRELKKKHPNIITIRRNNK